MTTIVKFLLLLLLSFFSFMGFANVSEERAIEKVVTDYMEETIQPEMTKKNNDDRKGIQPSKTISYSESVSPTNPQIKTQGKRPEELLRINVEILDISGNMASIKVSKDSHGFYDYLHLAKIDNQWKIVNVLGDNRRVK